MIAKTSNDSANSSEQQDIAQFRPIDRQFQRFLVDRFDAGASTALAGAVASALLGMGHSCLFVDVQSAQMWGDENGETIQLPPADRWIAALQKSKAVGKPGERKPLILDDGRLYIYKYFNFEKKVAARLSSMAQISGEKVPEAVIKVAKDLFNEKKDLSSSGGQLQAAGAFLPFFSRLTIITGGPGTGKTTVLAKLLALICADSLDRLETFPIIKLTAPTGKAAQRMAESIRAAAKSIPEPTIVSQLTNLIPSTLHRLLGLYGNSPRPKHDRESPIEADIVVIDEASMMDITLFARLVDALPADARLILLGDRFQLASVDAGCVMADICDAFSPNTFSKGFAAIVNRAIVPAGNHISASSDGGSLSPVVELKHSYRFEGDKPIGVVSKAVNSGLAEEAISALSQGESDGHYCRLTAHPGDAAMTAIVLEGFKPLLESKTPEEALERMLDFMVLTALNEGRFGRVGINQQVYRSYGSTPPVRPIKITENSIQHGLFNGDMGVIMRSVNADGTDVERAWFPYVSDGSPLPSGPDKNPPRHFLVGALPAHVDAFAITIHNSQGSEFDRVVVVLPEKDTPLLTRELLYTAITRAKSKAEIFGSEEIIRGAVGRKIVRHSGLTTYLKNAT